MPGAYLKRWRGGDGRKHRGRSRSCSRGCSCSRGAVVFGVLHGQGVDEVLHRVHLPLLHQFCSSRSCTEHWVLSAQRWQCHCVHRNTRMSTQIMGCLMQTVSGSHTRTVTFTQIRTERGRLDLKETWDRGRTKTQTMDGKMDKANRLIGQGVIRNIMPDRFGLTLMLQHTHMNTQTDTQDTH